MEAQAEAAEGDGVSKPVDGGDAVLPDGAGGAATLVDILMAAFDNKLHFAAAVAQDRH